MFEADGASHAMTAVADATRTAWFAAQGYRVVQFWNADILADRQMVWRAICALVPEDGPPPRSRKGASRPPRKGEGGDSAIASL